MTDYRAEAAAREILTHPHGDESATLYTLHYDTHHSADIIARHYADLEQRIEEAERENERLLELLERQCIIRYGFMGAGRCRYCQAVRIHDKEPHREGCPINPHTQPEPDEENAEKIKTAWQSKTMCDLVESHDPTQPEPDAPERAGGRPEQ